MQNVPDGLASADRETLREILRNAESYLGAQLTVVLASNQRAMAFVAILMGAFIVVVGAAGSLLLSRYLTWTFLAVAVGLLIAMVMALRAGRHGSFEFPGNTPSNWVPDVQAGKSLDRSLAEQAGHYAEMIASNGDTLSRDGWWFQGSVWLALATLAVGAALVAGRLLFV